MTTRTRSAALAALLLLAAAAGCSKMVDPKKSDPLNTAEGFCLSWQDVYQRLALSCGEDDTTTRQTLEQWRVGCDTVAGGESAGRYGYVRSIAEKCLAQFEGITCSGIGVSFFQLLETCTGAIPGLVHVGGSCYTRPFELANDCVAGAVCDSSSTCPGVCVTPGALYQPCATSPAFYTYGKCVDGAYCATAAVAPYPANTCLPAPTLPGSPCGSSTDYKCGVAAGGVQLYCGSTNSCYPAAPHGADCSGSSVCALATDYCRNSAGIYTCTTIPTSPQTAGGDCAWGGNSNCQTGLYCNSSANYTCAPALADGATCTSTSTTPCGSASHCSMGPLATAGTCVRNKQVGESCTVGFEDCSYNGGWCLGPAPGSPGVCKGPSTNGGPCGYMLSVPNPPNPNVTREYAECGAGTWCNQPVAGSPGTCQPYVAAGTYCLSNASSCGAPWTGLICDGASNVCTANACSRGVGFFPVF
jgi:hypothetical protein